MQRVRANGWKRIVLEIIPALILVALVFLDQWSKDYFYNLWHFNGDKVVIKNFFTLTYTVNTGAAWGFLSDKSWGQLFFKVLTSISLVAFVAYYLYAVKKGKTWLKCALILIIGGTIGNFIDRLLANGVVDFLSFNFWGYAFPVFNFADSFLTVGVIMLIVYYCFMDENAIFRSANLQPTKNSNGGEVEDGDFSNNAE